MNDNNSAPHYLVDIIKVSFNYQLTKIFIRWKTFPMRIKNIENKYLTFTKVLPK